MNPMILQPFAGLEVIAQGVFGTVYKMPNQNICVKVVDMDGDIEGVDHSSQETVYDDVAREWTILGKLRGHANIVPFFGISLGVSQCAIYMEYFPRTLSHIVKSKPTQSSEPDPLRLRTGFYMLQLVEAVKYAHEMGVMHRDIKPDNIYLNPREKRLVLGDFGSARQITINVPRTYTSPTTSLPYRPPEQIKDIATKTVYPYKHAQAVYDNRTDLWSLGCVLYEMVYRNRLFNVDASFTKRTEGTLLDEKHSVFHAMGSVGELRGSASVKTKYIRVIDGLLKENPLERMSLTEVKEILSGTGGEGDAPPPAKDTTTTAILDPPTFKSLLTTEDPHELEKTVPKRHSPSMDIVIPNGGGADSAASRLARVDIADDDDDETLLQEN